MARLRGRLHRLSHVARSQLTAVSTPAEKRYVNAKLSYEELGFGVRRWPEDRALRERWRLARRKLHEMREALRGERDGR